MPIHKTNPRDAVIAITYRCNARCTMCSIWKIHEHNDLPCQVYAQLPSSLRDVNVSGGEPFLRRDLPEIVAHVRSACPNAAIVISTNGMLPTRYLTEMMQQVMRYVPNIGVAVSLDGIGVKHDAIRGVPGAYNRAISAAQAFKDLGVQTIRFAFTIVEENHDHLAQVYVLAQTSGVDFTFSYAQSSDIYFSQKNPAQKLTPVLKEQLETVMRRQLATWNLKQWGRSYYTYGMLQFIRTGKQLLPNKPAEDFFFLSPDGTLYPSVVDALSMGNIREQSFEDVWNSERAHAVRRALHEKAVPSWMVCTARTAIQNNILECARWVLKKKMTVCVSFK